MPTINDENLIIVPRGVAINGPDHRHIVILQRPAGAVGQAASRSWCARKRRTGSRSARRKLAAPSSLVPSTSWPEASIGDASVVRPVSPDQIEIFERESDRVHDLVAGRAHRIVAMLFHPLAAPRRLVSRRRSRIQRRNVRRRQRRRACRGCFPEPISRAPPGKSGWRRRSPAGNCLGRASRAAHRRGTGTRRKRLPRTLGMP